MRIQRVMGIGGWLGVACCIAGFSGARADDIDEILKIERMAYEESAPSASVSETAPASSASMGSRVRTLESQLAVARREVERLQKAIVEQERRHQLELQRSYYNMGCVYKAAKQYERAESEFIKALAINPDDAGVHYNLGVLYDDDLQDKAKARQHYQKFLELAPNDKDAALVLEWLAALD